VIVTDRPIAEWLTAVAGQPGSFRTAGVGADVTLAPFYRTHRRIYTGYWDLLTPAENVERLKTIEAARERTRALEAATITYFGPDDASIERAHNQQGEETSIVRTSGRLGRRAARWFSYDLEVGYQVPAALVVTYNRDNRRSRAFDFSPTATESPKSRSPSAANRGSTIANMHCQFRWFRANQRSRFASRQQTGTRPRRFTFLRLIRTER
jgi:hypothetical protein